MNTIIKQQGLMTAEEAANKLGVEKSYFNREVAPNMGRWIGKQKYYTNDELEAWLLNKIGEDPEQ